MKKQPRAYTNLMVDFGKYMYNPITTPIFRGYRVLSVLLRGYIKQYTGYSRHSEIDDKGVEAVTAKCIFRMVKRK